jgi:DNA polymerase III, subunit gamma and tau
MENFIVSARKYRPQEFESVVGQSHITETLEYAIEQNQIPQALLFCGPRGVGKTTCARIFARKINEKDGATSDDGFAFNIYELDAASNSGVDEIRSLIEQVRYAPQQGKYKVYIIDEVHSLSQSAFNAFLKTLEEPPAYAIFVLATTEKHKILPTILSRCQIFDFKRITIDDIQKHLKSIAEKENIQYDEDALYLIAQKADGALRDALSMFDRLVTFTKRNITLAKASEVLNVLDYDQYLSITEYIYEAKILEVLIAFNDIVKKGFDPHIFIAGMGSHFRDLMMAKNSNTLEIIEVGEITKQKFAEQSKKWSSQNLVDAIEICNHADIHYKTSKNPRLTVEIALMQLSSLQANQEGIKKKKFRIIPPPFAEEIVIPKKVETSETSREIKSIDVEQIEEQIKRGDKPLRVGQQSIFSRYNIKSYVNKKDENIAGDIESEEEVMDEKFTQEELDTYWADFLQNNQLDSVLLYAISDFVLEKVENNIIKIKYTSESARERFSEIQAQFVSGLKQRIKNNRIVLEFELTSKTKSSYMSKASIFKEYAEINPLLKELDTVLNFDLL